MGGVEQAGEGRLNLNTTAIFNFTPGKTRRTSFTPRIQAFQQIIKPAIYLRKVESANLNGHP